MVLPEVTSPEATLTGNDVIGSYVTGTGSHVTGSDRVRTCNRFPRFFSYYSSIKCTIAHDRK